MKRGYVDTPDGQVYYLTEGDGEPLMMLHQGPRSSRMYGKLIPYLSGRYRVIAMDMLGYGRSDRLPEKLPTNGVRFLAQNVVHTMDAFGLDRAHLFGLHTGAGIGAEVAAGSSDRLVSVCLFGFPYVADEDERKDYFASREGGDIYASFQSYSSSNDGSHLARLWMRSYSEILRLWLHTANAPSEQLHPMPVRSPHLFMTSDHIEFLQRWVLDSLEIDKNMGAIYDALFNYDFPSRLPLIQAPTLLIDPDSPYENYFCRRNEMVKGIIPNSEAAVLPGSDDNAAEFKVPELAAMILDWLGRHPQ